MRGKTMTPSEFRRANPNLSDYELSLAYTLSLREDSAAVKLSPDGNPVYVAVDIGSNDCATECEYEVLPDSSIKVLDIRQSPPRAVSHLF
jgi:hypothetical protein